MSVVRYVLLFGVGCCCSLFVDLFFSVCRVLVGVVRCWFRCAAGVVVVVCNVLSAKVRCYV